MAVSSLARRGIADIAIFGHGKPIEEMQVEMGLPEIIQLDCNENPLGPSPKAVEAMAAEMAKGHIYPEAGCTLLRRKLAQRFGISEDEVILGNGADNILTMIAQAFINEGDEAVMAYPTFGVYENVVKIMGGRVVRVPLQDFTHDLAAILGAITPRTKLVFVCNPNNPTGTVVTPAAAADFLARVPAHCLVVWDEAYGEFLSPEYAMDFKSYIRQGRNLLVIRTFSKIYGLAGTRVGYAFGAKDIIDTLAQVVEPFAVNRLAQAGALAALDDEEFLLRTKEINAAGKEFFYRRFTELGLKHVPSQTNFVLVDLGMDALAAKEKMLARGIMIRPGGGWGLPTWARVTVGTAEQNKKFIAALAEIRQAGK